MAVFNNNQWTANFQWEFASRKMVYEGELIPT